NAVVAQGRSLDWTGNFDTPQKIAWHPIRARKKYFGLAGVFEIINPAVLEKSPDDADDADVFAQTRSSRPRTANAAHEQIDCHLGLRRFIERLDDLIFDQCIELGDYLGRLACARIVPFSLAHCDQRPFHAV